jgi:hypothetical protein
MISEIDGPNISVYPDTNQIGVFDAGRAPSAGSAPCRRR